MTIDNYQQTATHPPAIAYPTPPVEVYDQAQPAVWVPSAVDPNVMVPVAKQYVLPAQPAAPRDLTPQPLVDPRAQVIAASGVFAAGAGWGVGQVLTPLVAGGTGLFMWIAIAIVAARVTGGGRASTIVHKTVHNHNRWWGRSHTSA